MPLNEDDLFKAESALGAPLSFDRFEGVGAELESKIRRSRKFDSPGDIGDATVDELTSIEGIGDKRAKSLIKQAGGNPAQNRGRRSSGSVSAAGIRMPIGDFRVEVGKDDSAEFFNQSRSETARRVDSRRRAPITTDVDKWKDNPGDLDFPGVDTPSENPGFQFKDAKTTAPTDIVETEALEDLRFAEETADVRDPEAKMEFLEKGFLDDFEDL